MTSGYPPQQSGQPQGGFGQPVNQSANPQYPTSGQQPASQQQPTAQPPAQNLAPQAPQQPAQLSANQQIDAAAKQWKESAHRNIPGLGDLPVPDDTANLREGPSLNDGLLALLPLVGVWRGTGQADSPEDGQYAFGQQLTFAHDGENYLAYESRIWKLNEKGEATSLDVRESGFWRISLDDEIEVVCTHSTGVVEVFYGQPLNERAWEIEAASTMVTSTGPDSLGPGKRLYGLMANNHLGWVDERLIDGQLRPRMSAELHRVIG